MHTGKPLSGEATIPADNFVWSKSSHIPGGQPKPIPPRNEPLLYIPIDNNPHTSFDECEIDECESGSHHLTCIHAFFLTHTGKPLSGEATIPADDSVWSKSSPSHIPGRQPKPIPPRNEPLLYIPIVNNPHTSFDECEINECEIGSHLASAVAQACAQPEEMQHGIHHKTRNAERGFASPDSE